jgi:hypothetical protein
MDHCRSNQNQIPLHPNYRPIALCQTIFKLLTHVINVRLTKALKEHNILSETQAGFRKGYSTQDNIFTLICIKEEAAFRRTKLHCLKLDLSKAFDSIPHSSIKTTLQYYGFHKHDIQLIKALYKDSTASVITKFGITQSFQIKRGLKQGNPLSPTLFSLVINPLLVHLQSIGKGYIMQNTTHISNLTFADDIFPITDSLQNLKEKMFTDIAEFLSAHNLKINPNKTEYWTTQKHPTPFEVQLEEETVLLHPKKNTDLLKLLGAYIYLNNCSPYITIPQLMEKHQQRLQLIQKRPLPADTKAHLINLYASSKLLYHTYTNQFSDETIKKIDIANRKILREQLHLWTKYD